MRRRRRCCRRKPCSLRYPLPLLLRLRLAARKFTARPGTDTGQSQIGLLVSFELPATGAVQVVLTRRQGRCRRTCSDGVGRPGMYFVADPSEKGRFNILARFNNTAWLNMPAANAAALGINGNCSSNNINPLSLCGHRRRRAITWRSTSLLGFATPNGHPNGKALTAGNVAPADAQRSLSDRSHSFGNGRRVVQSNEPPDTWPLLATGDMCRIRKCERIGRLLNYYYRNAA